METKEILKAIMKLPVSQRIMIIEKTLKTIREDESQRKMKKAAQILLNDYNTDSDLTAFTNLDFEGFYETR